MNTTEEKFGRLLRRKRQALNLSQVEFGQKVGWPQTTASRVEKGQRGVNLSELPLVAQALRCSVTDLLNEVENEGKSGKVSSPGTVWFSPGFHAALENEQVLVSQLARFGVRFLGDPGRPGFVTLSLEETVLAALRYFNDPRVFEALPALLLRNAQSLDWARLSEGAYALRLQNRLGMVLAGALQLKGRVDVSPKVWASVESVHDHLKESKLDREEVVGPRPQSEEGMNFLRERTPHWARTWNGVSSPDVEAFRRYLL